jgi:hypothetical protein
MLLGSETLQNTVSVCVENLDISKSFQPGCQNTPCSMRASLGKGPVKSRLGNDLVARMPQVTTTLYSRNRVDWN